MIVLYVILLLMGPKLLENTRPALAFRACPSPTSSSTAFHLPPYFQSLTMKEESIVARSVFY